MDILNVAAPRAARALAGVAAMALGCLALPGTGSAEQLYGSAAILTNRPCPAAATSCTVPRDFTQFAGGMGVGFTTSADIPGGASGAAAVSFGDGYLPTVRVASTAGAETRTGASAVAFRSFTYEGDQAIDLALSGAIHYVNSGDFLAGENPGEGQFYVALSLLPISAIAAYGPGTDAVTIISNNDVNFADCSTGAIAWTDYFAQGTSGDNNVALSLSEKCGGGAITLNPGDQFLLVATLQAISNRGGWINAMNTFKVEYDVEKTVYTETGEVVGLAALQSTVNGAIPEPGAWALMILGFGGCGAMLRRHRGAVA